jgi:hypothetical protein
MLRTMMGLALMVLVTSAQAQTRPTTVDRSCQFSRGLVLARGAVVLGTGGYTYDRFVRNGSFCAVGEYTEPAFAPSLDRPQCFLGYRCKPGPREWFTD